jgi:hypothetical protein
MLWVRLLLFLLSYGLHSDFGSFLFLVQEKRFLISVRGVHLKAASQGAIVRENLQMTKRFPASKSCKCRFLHVNNSSVQLGETETLAP